MVNVVTPTSPRNKNSKVQNSEAGDSSGKETDKERNKKDKVRSGTLTLKSADNYNTPFTSIDK
jgi:hypothetical protein